MSGLDEAQHSLETTLSHLVARILSAESEGYETDPANRAKRGPDYVRPDEGISLSNGLKIESVSRSEGNFTPSGAGRSIWLT